MALRLLNRYEQVTYDALTRVCEKDGARVFPKVRVADVLPLKGSGISSAHYSYGLRAHFDFLVTDIDYQPLFCVEFDGPYHRLSEIQKERDRLKNDLCDRFSHSFLRINSKYLTKKYRGLDLLTYFVHAWFLEEAFSQAQTDGIVPVDEIFDMAFIAYDGASPDRTFPYWLSLDIQESIRKMHERGMIGQMVPSHYVGVDTSENYRCLSWVVLDRESVLYVQTGMRSQRFPAVYESELVSMLAMFDLYEKLKLALDGKRMYCAPKRAFFESTLPAFTQAFRMASSATCTATV